MTTILQFTSLQYLEGKSDRVYHAAIEPKGEGGLVTFACGRRVNTLTKHISGVVPIGVILRNEAS